MGLNKMRTIHIEKYYTCIEHLSRVFDDESRKLGFKAESVPEYIEWKENVRMKV